MKKYIAYLSMAALALGLSFSCQEEEPTDAEILQSRESVALEVSYTSGGSPISALSFTHSAMRKEIEVNINNENLVWNLVSNRDWLTVLPGEHRGSGTVTIEVTANENFEPREPASLTFVAGEFSGFRISASQSATAFIIGQPYFVSPREGGSFTTKITTVQGENWDASGNDWLDVLPGPSTTKDGFTTTTLTIKPSRNSGSSRYGCIDLTSGSETDHIWFYQFGSDLDYDADGNIFFAGEVEATFTLTAPAFLVKEVQAPAYVTATITENGDGTATVTFQMASNLSDCGESRQVEMSLQLANASASVVALPVMYQDYVPAYGLVTGKGMMAFAEAIATGASTADWEKDGVIRMIQDIDMGEVDGWEGIGTKEKPFTGTFDGGGFAILNLRNTAAGLFNYTNGATISGVTLGKGSSLYNNSAYQTETAMGGIVSHAVGTSISDCGFAGTLEFAGTSDHEEPLAYVGGIAGWADAASVIKGCKTSGRVILSAPPAEDQVCCTGGIAGLCEGSLTTSEITGEVRLSTGIGTCYVGGIEGRLPEGATVQNNSFMGGIILGGSVGRAFVGGIYGSIASDRSFDGTIDRSVALGTITLDSFQSGAATQVFAGGFAGKAEGGINLSMKGYEFQTNLHLDQTASRQASYVFIGGVLGGSDPEVPAESVSFEKVANLGTISTAYKDASTGSQLLRCFEGGVAGYIGGKASFIECTNDGEIGRITSTQVTNANTKHYIFMFGGIAGGTSGGDAVFTDCINKGKISVNHYSNSIPTNTSNGWYSACGAAGILGAFDYKPESEGGKLTMTGCINAGNTHAYRGTSAGIVCFARNATISGCSSNCNQDSANSNAPNKGGIAGWLGNSTVSNCEARGNIFCSNPASAVQSPGGIVSLAVEGGVKITGCSFYGVLSVNKGGEPNNCGGIIATAQEDTVIENCKYGGKVNGMDISENNVAQYATGNGLGKVLGTSYWNGN